MSDDSSLTRQITELYEGFAGGGLSRREFMRRATVLGIAGAAASYGVNGLCVVLRELEQEADKDRLSDAPALLKRADRAFADARAVLEPLLHDQAA